MIVHLQVCLPEEGVGLLSVIEGDNALVSAQYYPGRNVDASRTRYTMDPEQVLAAFRDMAWRGTKLGAIVHSHPRTPPTPSRLDLAEATLPNVLVVIAGFEPVLDVRAWRLEVDTAGRAIGGREVTITVLPREAEHRGRIGAQRIDRAGGEEPLDQLERRR
ncbi:MAG: M67 family metallopeptidase [Thermomicrobiales bacterium]|nr:M67 family metallopeptidase [Thermomicrobiales bacterium]